MVLAHLEVIGHTGRTFLAFLGLYQNNTTIGARTIDSGGTGVFQYLYRLDVLRVHVGHAVADDTVYNHQSTVVASGDGSATTQYNLRVATRLSCRVDNAQTRNRTLQCLTRVTESTISQYLLIHLRNSGGQRGTLLVATITRHHNFFERLSVFFHGDGQVTATPHHFD